DDLANLLQLLRRAEVRAQAPDYLAVARDDREQARLATADHHIGRSEALVAGIEPAIRAEIRRRVEVQPVERVARRVHVGRGLDRGARVGREPELVDVLAGRPLPYDAAVRRDLDEPVVLERGV